MYWLSIVNLTHTTVAQKEGPSVETSLHHVDLSMGYFLKDWCGRAQCTTGNSISGQVVLAYIRKQTSQATKNQPAVSTPLLFLPLILTWVPASMQEQDENCNPNKPFPPPRIFSQLPPTSYPGLAPFSDPPSSQSWNPRDLCIVSELKSWRGPWLQLDQSGHSV